MYPEVGPSPLACPEVNTPGRTTGQQATHAQPATTAEATTASAPTTTGQEELSMVRAMRICPTAGCPEITAGGRCPACLTRAERRRGTASQRGYDGRWRTRRAAYLRANPICELDGAIASVADHYPLSRRELLARRVSDPDADHRLRPLCASCHNKETAINQPGGWNAR